MAIVKKETIVVDQHTKELEKFVARTLEILLVSKEVTLNVLEKHDIILVFTWERDFIKGAVYQWSTFNMSKGDSISSTNKPLFISRRYLKVKGKNEVFFDENRIKELAGKNLSAFYPICNLVRDYKVKAATNDRLKCFW